MMIKKAILTILAAALIIASFAGCGGKAPEAEPTVSPTPSASASPEASPSASPDAETGTEETDATTATTTPTKKPEQPNTTQPAPTKKPDAVQPPVTQAPEKTPEPTPTPADISVSDLMGKMISALPADSHNMSALPSELYASVYQIDPSAYADVLIYGATMNVKANEIIVIKAKDSANLNAAKSALSNRLAVLKEQWKNYLPDQYEIVKAGTVVTKGMYAALVVAQDGQKAVSAFNSAIQ